MKAVHPFTRPGFAACEASAHRDLGCITKSKYIILKAMSHFVLFPGYLPRFASITKWCPLLVHPATVDMSHNSNVDQELKHKTEQRNVTVASIPAGLPDFTVWGVNPW